MIKLEFTIPNPFARRRPPYITAAAVLFLPVLAFASPVAIPNQFADGDPISAAEFNENFDALATAVNDNDTRVAALEDGPVLAECAWSVTTANATLVTADCAAGSYAVTGGCFSNPGLRSSGPTGPAAIVNGDVATDATGWACAIWDPDPTNRAFALCCAP
jgi:hypothetical protein